jgi:hypothetical protein
VIYEIRTAPSIAIDSTLDLVHDNPKSAKALLDYLRKEFPLVDLTILRDGAVLTDAELDAEMKSYDIQCTMQDASRLPSTYRHGRGSHTDDVATGADGNPAKVWGPENPEDRYE